MNTWIITAGRKCCQEVYGDGFERAWRFAQFQIESETKPVFELIEVPGGNGKVDSIDVYDCGYDVELIEQSGIHWEEGEWDEDTSFVEHCYIWEFTIEEAL